MGDIAIFTPEIAEALIELGFELVARTSKAFYFEDSAQLRQTVVELMDALENSQR